MKNIGTIVRGIRGPIIKQGDPLADIVVDSVLAAQQEEGFSFHDRDIVAVTEAVVARAQGNYATVEQIAADVRKKTKGGTVGLLFPILSRNRFSLLLKGIARGVDELIIQLSYPSDEVGNPLISIDKVDEAGIDTYSDSFTEEEFRRIFPEVKHPFTGIDYISLYKEYAGPHCKIVISNRPEYLLNYTDKIINADIHTRKRTKRILQAKGAKEVWSLHDFLTESVDGSGYNPTTGLLGSNLATENSVKLFPRDCQPFVEGIAETLYQKTGKHIEVMVYGDGAFKDPVGGIWELADPMISPGYTAGLEGTPNELKLKYIADTQLQGLSGEEAVSAMKQLIHDKKQDLKGSMASQGTTPRRLTDLLGSLCDLTSGSGDKGTPFVLIQHYFDNYSNE